ncbi:MAG: SPFH domain-containing protein, partial [Acidobacteriota bacterium]
MEVLQGVLLGLFGWIVVRCVIGGFYVVNQAQRAVKTSFGRAQRLGNLTTIDDPVSEGLSEDERGRYRFPQMKVILPGGPYFKWPW